jgi:16S rRNA U1498 N3-methylase RsmE
MIIAENQEQTQNPEKRLEFIRPILLEAVTQANQLALPKEVVIKEFKKLLEEQQ